MRDKLKSPKTFDELEPEFKAMFDNALEVDAETYKKVVKEMLVEGGSIKNLPIAVEDEEAEARLVEVLLYIAEHAFRVGYYAALKKFSFDNQDARINIERIPSQENLN